MPTKQKGGTGGYRRSNHKSNVKRVEEKKDKDKKRLIEIDKKKEDKEKIYRCKSEKVSDEKRSVGRQEKKKQMGDTITNKERAKLERINLLDEKKESKCPRYTPPKIIN